jgi:hypothetical protein
MIVACVGAESSHLARSDPKVTLNEPPSRAEGPQSVSEPYHAFMQVASLALSMTI